jgi:hypothetical protein
MGWHSEEIAARGGLGSGKAHHVGISTEENRCRSTCEVGEGESGEEEIGHFRANKANHSQRAE